MLTLNHGTDRSPRRVIEISNSLSSPVDIVALINREITLIAHFTRFQSSRDSSKCGGSP